MKKKVFILASAMIFAFLICVNIILSDTLESVKADVGKYDGLLVTESSGKIVVFYNGTDRIFKEIESPTPDELPVYDRELLKNGILVAGEGELQQLLEDYDY